MSSDDLGLVQVQQCHDNGLNHPHIVFPSSFSPPPTQRGASGVDPVSKTTTCELTSSFVAHHQDNYFLHHPTPDFRRQTFSSAAGPSSSDRDSHNWKASCDASTSAGESEDDVTGEDDDEEEEYDGADRCDDIEVQAHVPGTNNAKNNDRINSTSDNNGSEHIPGLKDGGYVVRQIGNERCNDERRNAPVTMEDGNEQIFCPQYVKGTRRLESDAVAPKSSIRFEKGCGFSGRKDPVQFSVSGEKLRAILSDPLTDTLMDDAMILPCGHSFGSGGIQHVLRMKACYTCSHPVAGNSISPNLSLRAAVQAFLREEELLVNCASKRKRERYEQDKGTYVESVISGHPRGRRLQFPFAVTDRVVIKGNKRTPPRFVGREAIVTTQCLNGWYVVKTLDNAESVKLQYRSLDKVPDNPSPMPISSKMPTNWL